ncbi:hypothetical protein CONLIGDRAFT_718455 [Coniochaeta ligniaria NRRL 30616]|uniref:Uncharacterized protein n=1 Tax=Coniochaeta ligniaria NRRL 30616 TaxID=1408157 RepID=A0A1J7IAP9_9PEZI|nr:hypothetical protein CONLIGDRAFT_718455 [Coniochaeta ligniaria NRRL 30616]
MDNTDEDTAAALAISPQPPSPILLPEDVLRMIFREYMSKPAIHFAGFQFLARNPGGRFHFTIMLNNWSKDDIKSGHVSSDIMQATCTLAREVALKTAIQRAKIRYQSDHGGTKAIDASTDLLCLVHPGPYYQPFPTSHSILDYAGIHHKIGRVRRGGVLVTKPMWLEVLGHWFSPEPADDNLLELRGPLGLEHLATLMICFRHLRVFFFVLTDLTEDDWNDYYSSLPITFHDHTGSYAEAYETPVHEDIVASLWHKQCSTLDQSDRYPYHDGVEPNLVRDRGFAKRVDAQLEHHQRVSLLLGLLGAARERVSKQNQAMQNTRIRVLARKPTSLDGSRCARQVSRPIASDEDYSDVVLGPNDSEAKWVKQTVDKVLDESDKMYELDGDSRSDIGTPVPPG